MHSGVAASTQAVASKVWPYNSAKDYGIGGV